MNLTQPTTQQKKIWNISIPPNGKYLLHAPFWVKVSRFRFGTWELNRLPNSSLYAVEEQAILDNAVRILGFNIDTVKKEIEVPPGIIFSLKIKRTQGTDFIELNATRTANKGMQAFHFHGHSGVFDTIQLVEI